MANGSEVLLGLLLIVKTLRSKKQTKTKRCIECVTGHSIMSCEDCWSNNRLAVLD